VCVDDVARNIWWALSYDPNAPLTRKETVYATFSDPDFSPTAKWYAPARYCPSHVIDTRLHVWDPRSVDFKAFYDAASDICQALSSTRV
jgi:hypothetical protein